VDSATGLPSGMPQRRTNWSDFVMLSVSANADASRLCFLRSRYQSDIYVGDIQASGRRLASLHQLTRDEAINYAHAWTPDSRAVLFSSNRDGPFRIYKQDVDKGTAELITHGPGFHYGSRISPNSQWLLYWNRVAPGDPQLRLRRMLLGGGADQEILSTDDAFPDISCSHTTGGVCVLVERQGNSEIVSLVDPMKGRGPKVLEITGEFTGDPTMSPDGRHIAFVLGGAVKNRIRIVDLHGITESEIRVADTKNLASLDCWSADGTVLWTQPADTYIWGIPSWDGRRLATLKPRMNANVWMVENP
jgi:Tol biopolymer transport system component